MSSVTHLTPSLTEKIQQKKIFIRNHKLLEFSMQEVLLNIEEFQFQSFQEAELLGIEWFQIIPEDNIRELSDSTAIPFPVSA